MPRDPDKKMMERTYARWAPVYDVLCGPVFVNGRRAIIGAAPSDVFGEAPVVLDEALRRACLKALECSREDRRVFALRMTWAASARMFLTYVAEVAKGAQAQAA